MNQNDIDERLLKAEKIVLAAGSMAAGFFRQLDTLQVESKGLQNFVSDADRQVEVFIRDSLKMLWPADHIIGEEYGHEGSGKGSGFTWVIDPIDGTSNFIRGMPVYCVLVALVYEGKTVLGFTFDPERNELFIAREGAGATLNGVPLRSSKARPLQESVIAVGATMKPGQEPYFLLGKKLLTAGIDYRRLASAGIGLAWTAAGRLDGFFEGKVNCWDVLPGILLNQELGNRSLAVDEDFCEKGGAMLVANSVLYEPLYQLTH